MSPFKQQVIPIRCQNERRGTTAVETAIALPIFLLVVFAMIEFGHVYMTIELINAAARTAARVGVANGRSTSDVENKINEILISAIDPSHVTVYIKDGSAFDGTISDDEITATNYANLADIEISDMEARQLFIVRIEVPYDQVTLIPGGGWLGDIRLSAQAVMRHE